MGIPGWSEDSMVIPSVGDRNERAISLVFDCPERHLRPSDKSEMHLGPSDRPEIHLWPLRPSGNASSASPTAKNFSIIVVKR